jgi:hypothetical protein
MSWIKIEHGLIAHKKTIRLAARRNWSRAETVGALVSLWVWACESADSGVLGDMEDVEIGAACGVGNSAGLKNDLIYSGFLTDSPLKLHDWPNRQREFLAGRYTRKPEQLREIIALHASNLPAACQQLASSLPATCQQLASSLPAASKQLASSLPAASKQLASSLPAASKQLASSLPAASKQLASSLPAACQQLASNLPAACQQLASNLPAASGLLPSKEDRVDIVDKDINKELLLQTAPAKPDCPPALGEFLIKFPLPGLGEVSITDKLLPDWKAAYPGVNIVGDLAKMRLWLLSNPTKRKTATGINRFIASWLAKEQNNGGNAYEKTREVGLAKPVAGKYDC